MRIVFQVLATLGILLGSAACQFGTREIEWVGPIEGEEPRDFFGNPYEFGEPHYQEWYLESDDPDEIRDLRLFVSSNTSYIVHRPRRGKLSVSFQAVSSSASRVEEFFEESIRVRKFLSERAGVIAVQPMVESFYQDSRYDRVRVSGKKLLLIEIILPQDFSTKVTLNGLTIDRATPKLPIPALGSIDPEDPIRLETLDEVLSELDPDPSRKLESQQVVQILREIDQRTVRPRWDQLIPRFSYRIQDPENLFDVFFEALPRRYGLPLIAMLRKWAGFSLQWEDHFRWSTSRLSSWIPELRKFGFGVSQRDYDLIGLVMESFPEGERPLTAAEVAEILKAVEPMNFVFAAERMRGRVRDRFRIQEAMSDLLEQRRMSGNSGDQVIQLLSE